MAQEGEAGAAAAQPLIVIPNFVGAGLIVIGAAFGIGRLASSAVESMARQPEVAANIQVAMIIAAALIEGFTFFALFICMLYRTRGGLIEAARGRGQGVRFRSHLDERRGRVYATLGRTSLWIGGYLALLVRRGHATLGGGANRAEHAETPAAAEPPKPARGEAGSRRGGTRRPGRTPTSTPGRSTPRTHARPRSTPGAEHAGETAHSESQPDPHGGEQHGDPVMIWVTRTPGENGRRYGTHRSSNATWRFGLSCVFLCLLAVLLKFAWRAHHGWATDNARTRLRP